MDFTFGASAEIAIREITAGTGIHGANQHKVGGEEIGPCTSGKRNGVLFQWLPEEIQGGLRKFRNFVQKENASVCERNGARRRNVTAPK